MQKVGGQGAAWHCGKKGSGGTPAAIFDKFVRSKDVAGRGQRGGNGGRWSAQQRISISFISIILIKLKKYIQGGGGGKQQNNNNQSRQKESRREEGEAEAGKTNQKKKEKMENR